MSMSHASIIEALKKFTTCDVSDALVKLKRRHGGFLPGLTMWSPQRQDGPTKIVGPAYTVKYVPLDDPRPKLDGHYIDTVPANSILFISAPARTPNAVYGGLMSTRASYLGCAGTIIDGRFRDLSEHKALGYPVFAHALGTSPPAEVLKIVAVNVPVQLQSGIEEQPDTWINPGDYLIADANGVVALPPDLAEEAIPLMERYTEADEKMAEEIKKSMSFAGASKKFRG